MNLDPTTLIGLIVGIVIVGVMYVQTVQSCLTKRFGQRDEVTGECVSAPPQGQPHV
jgi:hypothetical protein